MPTFDRADSRRISEGDDPDNLSTLSAVRDGTLLTDWSVLVEERPQLGANNMAIDEVLLESVVQGQRGPTLRLYRWAAPCLSLGVFQPYQKSQGLPLGQGDVEHGPEHPRDRSLAVVRRITGGGAIWHDHEWTYSIVLPRSHWLCRGDANGLYRAVHEALIAALAKLGVRARLRGLPAPGDAWPHQGGRTGCEQPGTVPQADLPNHPDKAPLLCFERGDPNDVVGLVSGAKLVGSAARRLAEGVLQHGSIPLRASSILASARNSGVSHTVARSGLPRGGDLSSELGQPVSDQAAGQAVLQALLHGLGMRPQWDDLTPRERTRAEQLLHEKYNHISWLRRR